MTEGKVQVSIGRTTGSKEYIHIIITDEDSRTRIVEVEMPLEEFAKCITGLSVCDIPATFGKLSLVGKKMEVKTLQLPLDYNNFDKFEQVVKPFEVDGWVADKQDGINHHYLSRSGYQVHFRRWV
jgi:hypothetical protein